MERRRSGFLYPNHPGFEWQSPSELEAPHLASQWSGKGQGIGTQRLES